MDAVFVINHRLSERYANVYTGMKTLDALVRRVESTSLLYPAPRLPLHQKEALSELAAETGTTTTVKLRPMPWVHFGNRLKRSYSLVAAACAWGISPDIVWSRNVFAGALTARLGIPTVIEHHTQLTERQRRALDRVRGHAPLVVLAISWGHWRALEDQGVPADWLVHSPLACTLNAELVGPPRLMRTRRTTLVYTGGLYRGRGIDLLLRVARLLPDIDVVIVGGPRAQARRYCTQAKAEGVSNIYFLGPVAHSKIPSYLAHADVLIAPYEADAETIDGVRHAEFFSPTKLFEYMASGKPIVATRVGTIPEILTDGRDAVLVEPEAEALSNAVAVLIHNREMRERLGSAARQEAESHTWEARVDRVLSALARRTA